MYCHDCQTYKLFEGVLDRIGSIFIQKYQILIIRNLPNHRITLWELESLGKFRKEIKRWKPTYCPYRLYINDKILQ